MKNKEKLQIDSESKILVIRLSAIGDVARTFSAVAQLRKHYPKAILCWLVEEKSISVIEQDPTLDGIIVFPRKRLTKLGANPLKWPQFFQSWWQFIQKLRSHQFEIVFDFHGIFKSGLLGWLSGAKKRIGYSRPFVKECNWIFTNIKISPSSEEINRYDRNMELIRPWTSKTQLEPLPLYVSIQDQEKISKFLSTIRNHDSFPKKKWVILHPGASKPHKQWFASNYAQLADSLIEKTEAFILLTWGPKEKKLAEEVSSLITHQDQVVISPKFTLKQFAELTSRATLFISADSGPMHIAAAMGTQQIALFGPTDPKINHPNNPKATIIHHPLACAPCRKGCQEKNCLQEIKVDEVFQAAYELLESNQRSAISDQKQKR